MNWKRGFRRIAFLVGAIAAVTSAALAVTLILIVSASAKDTLEWEELQYEEKYEVETQQEQKRPTYEQIMEELDRREALSPEHRAVEERNRALLRKQKEEIQAEKTQAKARLEKLGHGFWVKLSRAGLVGICGLAGLVGGGIGFLVVWLIYRLFEWIAFGFSNAA
jgi:methylthioribose-1-phosphate isomerase